MDSTTPTLLARHERGDSGAYEELLRRYEVPLRRFIVGHTCERFRNDTPVDDVFQETQLAALGSLSTFEYRRELAFFFWLCGIARNVIRAHARRQGRNPPVFRLSGDLADSSAELLERLNPVGSSPSGALHEREQLEVLAAGLQELPERRRQALTLRVIDGCDNVQAARRMGITVGAFRVLVARSLVQLKRVLDQITALRITRT